MNSFIPRQYKNTKTNEKIIFDKLAKLHTEMILNADGIEEEWQSNIAIILGEPASGKTYQLKEYADKNQHTHFVPLIALKENDSISEDIQVVLIDSIDEALTKNNQKTLARELKEYILCCKESNSKVRFVISCRFLEWSEYFKNELKTLDERLREYEILPLSKEDIDNLLTKKSIDSSDFWNFIDNNFLDSLFNNILITIYLIDNFRDYQNREVTYIDIYDDLSKRYLSEQGEDRENNLQGLGLEKLLLIASSLSTYLLLNRKEDIDLSNLNLIASELYKIDGKNIVASDLEIVLNSNLYKKVDNKFTIFHKSIQEYLMAYFIAQKNLNMDTLKKLFTSSLRTYEEFEEVVVYLTNLKPELFDKFVEFDPFIFKRHPSLTHEQQEKLLLSILNKYKVDFSQMWGRWESFESTTLVKFEKLDNLIELLEEHATLKEHGYYLMKLLENNYSDEIKEYMFTLFQNNISDKKLLKEVIRGNFIDNYDFNVSLYEFLKTNNLLETNHRMVFLSFEGELFYSLYGIELKEQYASERIIKRTEYDFDELVPLFDCIPARMLKYIAPYLQIEDSKKWFEYIKESYDENKYHGKYIAWVLYALLKDYDSQDMLIKILYFLNDKHIRVYNLDDIQELGLDFNIVADDFWTLYFESNLFDNFYAKGILELFTIIIEDIKRASSKYPVKDYPEKYIKFRLNEEINSFLMGDSVFKEYMEDMWKKHEEQQRKYEEELKEMIEESEGYEESQEREKQRRQTYEQSISNLDSRKDLYNIFNYLIGENHDLASDMLKLDQVLKEESDSKYIELLELIKQEWYEDKTYLDIKLNLSGNSIPILPLSIFLYLFFVSSKEEIEEYINNEEAYTKLYWHSYRVHHEIKEEYFLNYTERYFDLFVSLTIEALSLTFEKNDGRDIGNFATMIRLVTEIKKFNQHDLNPLMKYLKSIDSKIYIQLADYERRYLLEIVALDKTNYQFIHNLMIEDIDNCSDYLQILLSVNTNRALDDFFQVYSGVKRYSVKAYFQRYFSKKNQDGKKDSKYDNIKINLQKRDLYFSLIRAIKGSKIPHKNIKSDYFKKILTDYYDFFTEYERLTDTDSPAIYDKMYEAINAMWTFLESSTPNIQMLEELKKSKNIKLSERVKYTLTRAYEQQEKDRNYPNSYYKNIFEEESKVDKTTININGGENNIAINSKDISQTISMRSKDTDDLWWMYSAIAGLITILIIWWSYDSWYSAIPVGIISSFIVWKLNPKFRFRNIGYALLTSGVLSNIISFSGAITIPKNDLIHGVLNFAENNVSILLVLLCIPFFILDYYENKK